MNKKDRCANCGSTRENHIDFFDTGRKNVCPCRKAMTFLKEEEKNNETN